MRSGPARGRIVAVTAGVILALGTLVLVVPWARKDRPPVTGTPVAPAFSRITPVVLSPGRRACLSDVALDSETSTAVLASAPGSPRRGPALRLGATGPGYRSISTIPGGYGARVSIGGPLRVPGRSLLVRLCVRNTGRDTARLGGSLEPRSTSRPQLTIDGRASRIQLALALQGSRSRTVAGDLGTVLRHVAAFRPWPLHRLVLGLLLALVIVGVPAGVWLALVSAAREEELPARDAGPSHRGGW